MNTSSVRHLHYKQDNKNKNNNKNKTVVTTKYLQYFISVILVIIFSPIVVANNMLRILHTGGGTIF